MEVVNIWYFKYFPLKMTFNNEYTPKVLFFKRAIIILILNYFLSTLLRSIILTVNS